MAGAGRVRNITFNTGRITSKVRGAKKRAMTKLAKEQTVILKNTVNIQGPPRSTAGNAPHKETGKLHKTIEVVFRKSQLVVRTLQYGLYLEGGTSKMDPRPHIDPVMRKKRLVWERRARVLLRQELKSKTSRRK